MNLNIVPYKGILPKCASDAFIAHSSVVVGDVEIGSKSSVWFHSVIRGDVSAISIGKCTNLQDGTIVHVSRSGGGQTVIGDFVTIGHRALIHACTINSQSFVGMGAIIMDGSILESNSMVAAGSVVTPGKRIYSGQLWAGCPASYLRNLTKEEIKNNRETADHYVLLSAQYAKDILWKEDQSK